MPQFSAIIPAFNAAATVANAIESVLAQTCKDYEIIVVNDGSTDHTAEVLARFSDRIRLINQANRGLSGARNAGAAAARANWLALLDADDTWTPDKLDKIAKAIDFHSAVMLFSDANCFDPADASFNKSFMPSNLAHAPTWEEMMAGRFQILPSSAVIRHDAYDAIGGFSEEFRGASGFEDVYFWLRLREHGAFGYVRYQLVNYRIAPLSIRLERYRPGFDVFARLVRKRYGNKADQLIEARRKARVTRWSHLGLEAMRRGEKQTARRAFLNALDEGRWRRKDLLRLLRTFLPMRLAQKLAGHASDPSRH